MPLLQESAHSVATIKHSMDKIKEACQFDDKEREFQAFNDWCNQTPEAKSPI